MSEGVAVATIIAVISGSEVGFQMAMPLLDMKPQGPPTLGGGSVSSAECWLGIRAPKTDLSSNMA
jgi:hypothetical protein